jgi:hypothetical protein
MHARRNLTYAFAERRNREASSLTDGGLSGAGYGAIENDHLYSWPLTVIDTV